MNCGEFRNDLLLSQSGELPGARQMALQAHLDACPECRRFGEESAAMADAARRALRSGAPARETLASIKRRASLPGPGRQSQTSFAAPEWTPLRKLALAASLAVALGSAVWTLGVLLAPGANGGKALPPTQAMAPAAQADLKPGMAASARTPLPPEKNLMVVEDESELMLSVLHDELFAIEDLRVSDGDARMNALDRELLILHGLAI